MADVLDEVIVRAIERAVFGGEHGRREFVRAVGATTAAAVLASVFPVQAARALAQDKAGPPEKKDLKIGFIPITCATPIIMAEPMGFYKKQGLNVNVVKASSWAMIRDLSINGETDATHMLSPMPLAISMGVVANLRAGNLDGYLGPDPFNQRAVFEGAGFIWMLSKDIWPGHPCCAFAAKREFAEKLPNTFKAVLAAIIDATQYAHDTTHRKEIAAAIAPRNFLNQPVEVVEQVLTGVYPDGLGATKTVPDRIDFDPFPYQSMAVWILTQMKRWGYVKTDVTYKKIAEEVFLASACRDALRASGARAPESNSVKHTFVLGGKSKVFDPDKPEDYIKSFAIKRA